MMKSTLTTVITLLISSIVGLSACTSKVPSTALENTTWVLESYGKQTELSPILEGTKITAAFNIDEGKVNGSAGCNNYFSGYIVNGNKLSISDVGTTMMFCDETDGIMDQEKQYITLLQEAKSFQIKNNQLWIFSSGDQVLVFNAQ